MGVCVIASEQKVETINGKEEIVQSWVEGSPEAGWSYSSAHKYLDGFGCEWEVGYFIEPSRIPKFVEWLLNQDNKAYVLGNTDDEQRYTQLLHIAYFALGRGCGVGWA